MKPTIIWRDYLVDRAVHTVTGDLRITDSFYSPQLRNRRDLFVLLPPSYAASQRRYPVIYMQDGQNLFDAPLSYAGEWQVDETMQALSASGMEAIIVGIPNAGVARIEEYSPFKDRRLAKGGRGDWYVAFMANTVKPLIDGAFRTLPEREHTGVFGSSMGGLISLYTFFCRPEIFGMAGAMSPSLWFAHEAIFPYVREAAAPPGRIYLDLGTHEGVVTRNEQDSPHRYTSRYLNAARAMRDLLERKGYLLDQQLRYVEEEDALHNEAAWARRLPAALRFLLANERRPVIPAPPPEKWVEF